MASECLPRDYLGMSNHTAVQPKSLQDLGPQVRIPSPADIPQPGACLYEAIQMAQMQVLPTVMSAPATR